MEIIKDIPGYEGIYSVSTTGTIFSYPKKWKCGINTIRKHDGIVRKQTMDSRGYLQVDLRKNKKAHRWLVHHLVAMTFIPRNGKECVNHKNGIKTNNDVSNLEWTSFKDNIIHAVRNGLRVGPIGEKHWGSRLKEKDILKIRSLFANGKKVKDISNIFGVSDSCIKHVINKRTWNHI